MQFCFHEAARLAFEAMLASSSGQRRQTHGELQDKLQLLLQNIKQVNMDSKLNISRTVFKLDCCFFFYVIGRKGRSEFLFVGYSATIDSPFIENIRFRVN